MKCSEGGFDWATIIELDCDEFDDSIEAARELERRIEDASKRK